MFGIGPMFLFIFKQRLPFGMMRSGAEPWFRPWRPISRSPAWWAG